MALSVLAQPPLFAQNDTGTKNNAAPLEIPVHYRAPENGFLSLALYDKDDVLVRTLLCAKPVKRGNHTVMWDGASDLGIPLPEGPYQTKGIFFKKKPSADFVMTVGKSGNPPYRTKDDKGDWGGNLGRPAGLAANSNSVLMVWGCVEDHQITGIQQMDPDGNIKMRYGSFYPWDTRLAAVMDETNIYLGIFSRNKNGLEIAKYTIGNPKGKLITNLPETHYLDKTESQWHGRKEARIEGMALTKHTLYATEKTGNKLYLIDRKSEKVRKTISIKSPRDIKIWKNKLLIQSEDSILLLSLEGKTEKTIVKKGLLKNPRALAIDPKGGFFSNGYKGQIARFDQHGKVIATIGKRGGAAFEGKFDSAGIGSVFAMQLGANKKSIWVQDIATGFARTSRWSFEGKLIQEWFTSKLDLWKFGYNTARPTELVRTSTAFSDVPGMRAYKIDLKSKTWRPSWFYHAMWDDIYANRDVYKGYTHGGNRLSKGAGKKTIPTFDYNSKHFVTKNGKHYFVNAGGNGDGAIYQYSENHKPRPIGLIGFHPTWKDKDGKYQGRYDNGPNEWFIWTDKNFDTKMSHDEINHVKGHPLLKNAKRADTAWLDTDLNIHITFRPKDRAEKPTLFILKPVKMWPNGVPEYDWNTLSRNVVLDQPSYVGGDGVKEVKGVHVADLLDENDGYYALMMPKSKVRLTLPGIDGTGWWASRNWRHKVTKFDKKTGKLKWSVGRRTPGLANPGEMYHPASISGKINNAVLVPDTLGPVWVWNTDGLYMGFLFRDSFDGETYPEHYNVIGEIQSTLVFTDPNTGKNYHVMSGNDLRMHEVFIPTPTPVKSTKVTLSKQQSANVLAWDPDGLPPGERPKTKIYPASGPVKIDGKNYGPEGWSSSNGRKRIPELIMVDGKRIGQARLMYDAKYLYMLMNVESDFGPLNAGTELPYCPFVSGAYVDVNLAADWKDPQRKTVKEGDVRIVFANIAKENKLGTPYHRGFWMKKRKKGNTQEITSPVATVKFDDISKVPGVKFVYRVKKQHPKTKKINYDIEIAIPLSTIGITPKPGMSIGFDMSIGISNDAGHARVRAGHWAGESEGRVVDRPGSTILLPQNWGTLTFAK